MVRWRQGVEIVTNCGGLLPTRMLWFEPDGEIGKLYGVARRGVEKTDELTAEDRCTVRNPFEEDTVAHR